MSSVILVIHLFLALAIIGLILLQRSEGGGLGIGGGGGGLGGFASPKGTANFLTRATSICAAAFFCTSLILGILAGRESTMKHSILDALETPAAAVQTESKADDAPAVPIDPAAEADSDASEESTSPESEPAVPIAD